jgi:mannose-6-phosphate isomerase
VLVAVDGAGTIETHSGQRPLQIARGDTIGVPYGAGDLTLAGQVTIIRCLPPAASGHASHEVR